jgi:hypothetical protein
MGDNADKKRDTDLFPVFELSYAIGTVRDQATRFKVKRLSKMLLVHVSPV